ncbi:YdcF family protein [Streptococcus dysgalactiae subsp. equisimilis]|uniref:YdcF family protein n=1 Tax=Streptococcus dysgalactiae TaxID=1334 RepID=UPI003FD803D8
MIYLLLTVTGIAILAFIKVYKKEPRTLWLGTLFVVTGLLFSMSLFLIISLTRNEFTNQELVFMLVILGLVLLVLLLTPLMMILVFLFNGITLLRREGVSVRNLLLLCLAIAIMVQPFVSGFIVDHFKDFSFLQVVYEVISIILNYIVLLMSAFTLSSLMNSFYLGKNQVDYIVVLGSGLNGDKVTPLLASRIKKGIEIYKKNPDSQIIMSGGQGDDELIAEGLAMKNFAVEQGISQKDVLVEDKSTNTRENILFSEELMAKSDRFCLVTNHYHLFRALLTARELGLACRGYGAKTKLYFTLNAFIREFIGYLYLKRKLHIMVMMSLIVIYTILKIIAIKTT